MNTTHDDFAEGTILDKQRSMEFFHNAERDQYMIKFKRTPPVDLTLEEHREEVVYDEDGAHITRIVMHPDTMEAIVSAYCRMLLARDGAKLSNIGEITLTMTYQEKEEEKEQE